MKKRNHNEDTTPVSPVPIEEGNDTDITEVGSVGSVPDQLDQDEWDGPTREVSAEEVAALAIKSTTEVDIPVIAPGDDPTAVGPPPEGPEGYSAGPSERQGEGPGQVDDVPEAPSADPGRLENVVESLLFASDRPLTIAELKRLTGERQAARLNAALEALRARREESGIQVIPVAGGWHLRTHPGNAAWVSRLITGRAPRLSRALLETLSIVAYRQPVTRPEIDEIRGVDSGPVLGTLLERGLVRMIGKKEEVGRPILYGTTPEFLRTFSLRDLNELPTLREFHELSEAHQEEVARVDAEAPPAATGEGDATAVEAPPPKAAAPGRRELDPEEDDELLTELERAASAAAKATATVATATTPASPADDPAESSE
jgi:segregation and condensation protein B